MRRTFSAGIVLSFVLSLLCGCALRSYQDRQSAPSLSAPPSTELERAADAVQRLQQWYTPTTGLYQTTGWWNSANILTALADYERASGSRGYTAIFANTFVEAQKTYPEFLNNYYDDEGWWALAWIDVYDLTRDPRYLMMAKSIFADMDQAWDGKCGGGIWWSKDRKYKNAIANELFLSVAAHLANRTKGAERKRYLSWGYREWRWFVSTGMINSNNLINDGLAEGSSGGTRGDCVNNQRTVWSYNQGVVLGGLAELSIARHDPSLLVAAQGIAMAAITELVDSKGVLHDPCEPKCGADGVQFKGIFIRNLVLLDQRQPQTVYRSFVNANADSIWNHARGPGLQLGQSWAGPFFPGNAATQSSALDALVGALSLRPG